MHIPADAWNHASTEERALLTASALCSSLDDTARGIIDAAGANLVVSDEATERDVQKLRPVRLVRQPYPGLNLVEPGARR